MDSITTSRNKARDIESEIVSRIAAEGVTAVAKKLGVDKSQVSRWQSRGGLVEKASRLLAALDFQQPAGMVIIKGDETGELAQCLIGMLEHIRSKEGGAVDERFVETDKRFRDKRGIVVRIISYDRQERRVISCGLITNICAVCRNGTSRSISSRWERATEQRQLFSRVLLQILPLARSIMRQKRSKPQQETTVHKDMARDELARQYSLMPVGCYVRR